MSKKKNNTIISVLMCFFIAIGTFPVYAASETKPNSVGGRATVWFAFVNFREKPSLSSDIKKVFLIGKTLEVLGIEEDFINVKDPKTGEKGYVFKILLIYNEDITLNVTSYNNVYKGDIETNSITIEYNGSKNITWFLSKKGIVEVTKGSEANKLTVKGIEPGSVVLTVRAGLLTATCDLHCYYLWNKEWTSKAKVTTTIWKGPGTQYGEKETLSKNAKFIVNGDDGGSAGWAYGYTTKNNKNYWGYVKINDISTKGTVSQYNNLNWLWPVVTPSGQTKANYISSPYGKRDTTPNMHKGFDITTGVSGGIDEYEVVSAFAGEVVYVSTNANNSTGYCVGIKSNITDPISGEYIVAFYMHLKHLPLVRLWQKVSAGDLLGYVGNTGNSGGYHLHFEANNKNASIGDGSTARQYYAYLINPLFFYMDKTVRINSDCDAEKKYYGSYWYGND